MKPRTRTRPFMGWVRHHLQDLFPPRDLHRTGSRGCRGPPRFRWSAQPTAPGSCGVRWRVQAPATGSAPRARGIRKRVTCSIPPSCCSIPMRARIDGAVRWHESLRVAHRAGGAWPAAPRSGRFGGAPSAQCRRGRRIRLAGRPAPAGALVGERDLRVPREGDDRAASGRAGAIARHLARACLRTRSSITSRAWA